MTTTSDADMTLEEVAAVLRKSYETVSLMARQGRLPGAYQLTKRGRWAVRRRDFEQWHMGLGPQRDPHAIAPRTSRSQARRMRAS